jgi:hypothetical protein
MPMSERDLSETFLVVRHGIVVDRKNNAAAKTLNNP